MKIITILIGLMLIAILSSSANANPFLVDDPQSGVTTCVVTGVPIAGTYPALSDGSCKIDLSTVPVGGPWDISVKVCDVWGCSPSSPFTLPKRSILTSGSNWRLSQ